MGTPSGQRFAQKKISSFIPGIIEWKAIDLTFTKTCLEIKDIKLYTTDHQKVFSADRLFVDMDFSHLFQKEFVFTAVEIDALKIDATVNEKGELNIVQALVDSVESEQEKTAPSGLPFNILAKNIKIADGRINFFLPSKKIQVTSGKLDVHIYDVDARQKQGRILLDLAKTAVQIAEMNQMLDSLKLELNVENSALNILSANIISGDSHLSISGKLSDIFGVPDADLLMNAGIAAAQVSRILDPKLQITGVVNADIKITGPLDNPECSVNAIARSISAFEQTMAIKMTGGIKDQSVFVSNFQATAKGSVVNGQGNYNFDTTDFDSQISISARDINDFTAIFGLPAKGRLFVDGKIFGDLDRPKADLKIQADDISFEGSQVNRLTSTVRMVDEAGKLKGTVQMKAEKLQVQQIRIGNLDADADLSDGILNLTRVSVQNHRSAIDLSGKIHLLEAQTNKMVSNPDMDIQLNSGTVFLSDFSKEITGTLSARGRVKGKADDFTGHLDLKAAGLKVDKWQIGSLDMALTGNGAYNDPQIQGALDLQDMMMDKEKFAPLKLKLLADKHTIFANGSFGFDVSGSYQIASQSFDAKMQLDSVQLAPYFKMAGQEEFSGSVNGVITAKGSLDKLQLISATANLSDFVLFFKNKEAIHSETLQLSLNQGKLELPETKILLFEKAFATVSGQGKSAEAISVQFNTDFPVALIDPVFEQIDQATGRVVVNAKLEGDITKPNIKGQIQLIDIGMALSYIDNNFKRINGLILMDSDTIKIDQIKGFLGDGEFFANGMVKISKMEFESGQIVFQTQQLPLNFPDLMDLTINSKLLLKGTREKSNLTGEIVLLEGRYYKDIKLDILHMTQKKRTVQPVTEKKNPSFLDNMALDIGVTRREPFLVENNLATLFISPDLRVTGVASNPLLNGRAQVDSGMVKFQKKEFEVKKGVIDFVNPYRIEPVIDLEGSTDVRSWTIILAVSGTPENLDFKFNSNPPEQHADIVSLLAFGKTTRELRASQGGSNLSPAQVLSGFVADTVQKNLKDISGLDYVDLGITANGGKEGYGGKVTVGKDLSRQLTVKYGVDARSGGTVQRVTTDYKLLENLLMSGYQDTGGDFGGALKYRLEFR